MNNEDGSDFCSSCSKQQNPESLCQYRCVSSLGWRDEITSKTQNLILLVLHQLLILPLNSYQDGYVYNTFYF